MLPTDIARVIYLRRRYTIALIVVVLAALAAIVVPRVTDSSVQAQLQAELNTSTSAFERLKVPSAFVLVAKGLSNKCLASLCYRAPESSRAAAKTFPAILRSVGIPSGSTHGVCSTSGICTVSALLDDNSIGITSYPLVGCRSARRCTQTNASLVYVYGP